MRVCLFDWHHGGHHAAYLRGFARALRGSAEVVAAAPDVTLAEAALPRESVVSLGAPRPRPASGADREGPGKAELANAELDVLAEVAAEVRPDQIVLLFADPVLRWLVGRPQLTARTSICIHFPQSHFKRAYGVSAGGPTGRLRARFKDHLLARWARRGDAGALFVVDREAARLWGGGGRAAFWLPEPPLDTPTHPQPWPRRGGAVLFGYLDSRKGVDRVADALLADPAAGPVVLAGESAPEFRAELEGHVARAQAGGADLQLRLGRLPGDEAMRMLGSARCALLSFGWRPSASRVLLEAAASGTPVVGSGHGTVGHLIRSHGLGIAVDPRRPREIAAGIRRLTEAEANPYAAGLDRYARQMAGAGFAEAVAAGLGLREGTGAAA